MNSNSSLQKRKTRNPWHPAAAFAQDARFPWRLFWAALGTAVASHCLFGSLLRLSLEHIPAVAIVLVSFVGVAYSAMVIHAERLSHRPIFLAIALAGLFIFVLGVESFDTFSEHLSPAKLMGTSGLAFGLFLFLVYHWRHEAERGRNLERSSTRTYLGRNNPIRALILTVSKPETPVMKLEVLREGRVVARFLPKGQPPVEVKGPNLTDDIKTLDEIKPNWQQLLRGLEPHVQMGALEYVTLYGSKDSRLEDCAAWLGGYLPSTTRIRVLDPVNLEDFEAVHTVLAQEVHRLNHEHHIGPEELALDITGGTKILSIAGAVLTLNRAVVCQYVQSTGSASEKDQPLQAQIYDFRWDKSLELPV